MQKDNHFNVSGRWDNNAPSSTFVKIVIPNPRTETVPASNNYILIISYGALSITKPGLK